MKELPKINFKNEVNRLELYSRRLCDDAYEEIRLIAVHTIDYNEEEEKDEDELNLNPNDNFVYILMDLLLKARKNV